MTIRVLAEKDQNHCEIARTLGVMEGAVRYRLRRLKEGARDGRADKPFQAEAYAEVIERWVRTHERSDESGRPVNVVELHEHLVEEHGYEGHYRSLLRYMRARYPKPKKRTYRWVENPAGAQSQTDWAEYHRVELGQ